MKNYYLIVGPSWIGDMVMAQSLLMTLKQQQPNCQIDMLAPSWSLPIIERMPEIEQAISLDVNHGEFSFFKRRRLGIALRQKNYTHAIIIPRSWKSALVPYFANITIRTGYLGELRYGLLNDIRQLNKNILKQTVQRYVAHALKNNLKSAPQIAYPTLRLDKKNQQQKLTQLGLNKDQPIVCFMPGAEYGSAKQWPVKYFAQLASLFIKKGWQVWVIGSEKDKKSGEIIKQANSKEIKNLCGKTTLVDTVDLLACANTVISNDSGLMHIAAAVGVKVNVIYGSSTPDYTPPLTQKKKLFYLNLSCSPCFKRICPLGHTDCLQKIKPEHVFEKMDVF